MRLFLLGLGAACALGVSSWASPAAACGGCFHEPPKSNETPSLVTDHRMAFSISKTHTILWDQVRYAGNPKEFAWVLPVRQGTTVEVGRDEFLSILDQVTAPIVNAPKIQCYYPPISYDQGGGGGFGCGSTASSAFDPRAFADGSATFDASNGFPDGGVEIIGQKVVGPYESVIVRSSQGQAISDWLKTNGFVIPSSIDPIIAYYTQQGFDFVAIRLRPDVGVRAMQPIRIVSPGADATLPLRMVAAGVGAKVGLELFVLGEGRYEATSFANALVDRTKVKWDAVQQRSNYAEQFDLLTSSSSTGVWVTEYAGKDQNGNAQNGYANACTRLPPVAVACAPADAGAGDGGAADSGASDAGCTTVVPACNLFDDFDRANEGINPADLTIVRLRANLPPTNLTTDLKLGAAVNQSAIPKDIQTTEFVDPKYDPCPGGSTTPYPPAQPVDHGDGCTISGRDDRGTAALGIGVVALGSLVRRAVRRRRR